MAIKGDIFVISAPSGAGKSTLVKRLFEEVGHISFSISFTTRPARDNEKEGKDYFFVDGPTFDHMVAADKFVEWVQVYEHRYGTGKAWLQGQLEKGMDVLLDLDTAGAKRIKELYPDSTLIFLLPPSAQLLASRLRGRDKDSEEQIAIRLQHAKHEMEQWENYEYLVLNDDLEIAYRNFRSIFLSTRASKRHMAAAAKNALDTF